MNKAWVVSVNMGYGHQRAVGPLKNLAFDEKIISANSYQEIPKKDQGVWKNSRKFYELVSAFKKVPLIGELAFYIFDQFQKIHKFDLKKDLSKPSIQLRQTFALIEKGFGRHLIEKLKEKPLPLITSFFIPAFMAEFFKYPGKIFCIICDADISRAWAPLNPKESRIKYLAPTQRAVQRLKLYGVRSENIFLTGFPLPMENIGSEKLEILKSDLRNRILNLDLKKTYQKRYGLLIEKHLGILPSEPDHPLTVMFAIGGAGVQKEIGVEILESLSQKIKIGKIKLVLSAGTREEVKTYFEKNINKLGLGELLVNSRGIEIIFQKDFSDYFKSFNKALRKTDILWTKPSELSLYSALGLPIIIAPTIGSQEKFNKKWLLSSSFGVSQKNPKQTQQWLFELLEKGHLAEIAMNNFIKGEKLGTLNIKKIISSD